MSQNKKEIRKNFRDAVFKRDKYTCQICGKKYSPKQADPDLKILNAHHITDRNKLPNGGYTVFNGIAVCDENGDFPGEVSCHMLVEQYHISGGDLNLVEEPYRPSSLYKKIGSSYELALEKSKKLK